MADAAPCAGTPVFAEDSVRVLPDAKGTVACWVGGQRAHDLGTATPLEAEGSFLAYRSEREGGSSEIRLLDVRSGKQRMVSSAGFRASTSVVGLLADGTVGLRESSFSGAAIAFRFVILPLDGTRRRVTEGARCDGCDPPAVAGSEAFALDGSGQR